MRYRDSLCFHAVVSIVALALLTCPAHGAEPDQQHLAQVLKEVLKKQKTIGLALGIVQNGHLAYAHGFGSMKLGEAKPITPVSLFHMASITKTFIATSIMQLVEQGKIDLDAPVTTYLPYFRLQDPRYKLITIRQMLGHTSGMPDVQDYRWDKPEYDDGALERYTRSLANEELLWAPGSKFRYSNIAFECLGDVVSKVSGKTIEAYVEENILKPLGMSYSTLLSPDTADSSLVATGYETSRVDGTVRQILSYPYNRAHTPSSDLLSNVLDMARWAMANLNRGQLDGHRILNSSTYDLMWKPYAKAEDRNAGVGISWFLGELYGQKAVWHNGSDDGFDTRLVLFPDRNIAVFYMSNCDWLDRDQVDSVVLPIALGDKISLSR